MSTMPTTMPVFIHAPVFSHKLVPETMSASAMIGGCNFACQFCGARGNPFMAADSIPEFSQNQIREQMHRTIAAYSSIKIGGAGEPTLHPAQLELLARIARDEHAEVIVDTNGSRPDVILALIEAGLIDQVEVGLKGFTPEMAATRSGTRSTLLAWEHPHRLIRTIAEKHPSVRVFPTFVLNADTTAADIETTFALFAHLASSSLYLRFDNLIDPVDDDIVFHLLSVICGEQISFNGIDFKHGETIRKSAEGLAEHLLNLSRAGEASGARLLECGRTFLRELSYPDFTFRPADRQNMIDMIRKINSGHPEYENRVIVVSHQEGKYSEKGLLRLWLEP
jgi:pyruvate-formate lyase-activating enzyme